MNSTIKEATMPELPQKKVGIVACSGEELSEGTVTRLAAIKVLEKMRPGDTVTICLPLFLAGGEGDRAFAKFYPTIAVDGCEKRCAYRGTEHVFQPTGREHRGYRSGCATKPGSNQKESAGSMQPGCWRSMRSPSKSLSRWTACLDMNWSRRKGIFTGRSRQEPKKRLWRPACAVLGFPSRKLQVNGEEMTLVALPIIFQNLVEWKKAPSEAILAEIMATVKNL